MGKFTDLSSMVKVFPAADSGELYNQTYQIGDDVGTLIRVILGFDNEAKKKKFWSDEVLTLTDINLRLIKKQFKSQILVFSIYSKHDNHYCYSFISNYLFCSFKALLIKSVTLSKLPSMLIVKASLPLKWLFAITSAP